MDNPVVMLLLIALVIAVGVALWFYTQKKKTEDLREHFGPEYKHAVDEHDGDRRAAEHRLEERKERIEKLNIRPLEADERDRFAERWRTTQAQFVDEPTGAVKQADELIGEVMEVRGYPVGDFERRAEDISVDHPRVVEHYRIAHAIAVRNDRGDADTEALREAMVHYRALFEDLLETAPADTREVRR
jgi:hypothetical protein